MNHREVLCREDFRQGAGHSPFLPTRAGEWLVQPESSLHFTAQIASTTLQYEDPPPQSASVVHRQTGGRPGAIGAQCGVASGQSESD